MCSNTATHSWRNAAHDVKQQDGVMTSRYKGLSNSAGKPWPRSIGCDAVTSLGNVSVYICCWKEVDAIELSWKEFAAKFLFQSINRWIDVIASQAGKYKSIVQMVMCFETGIEKADL